MSTGVQTMSREYTARRRGHSVCVQYTWHVLNSGHTWHWVKCWKWPEGGIPSSRPTRHWSWVTEP